MDVKAYLSEQKGWVDAALAEIVSTWPATGLAEAMAYSLTAGGKRLRPILTVTAFRCCRGRGEAVYRGACSLELLHTYTLIHDDLPAMDDDDFRRGLPTCHRKFGVRRALFAGSALLLAAFTELSRCTGELGLEPEQSSRVVASVAGALGGGGVVGGQLVDLQSERKPIGPETLDYIHSHKTGALIRVSCTLGALLAGAGGESLSVLADYGENIGLAFQIVDDLLDVEGDSAELGKTAGGDQARGKATFPSVYGAARSRELAGRAVERAKDGLRETGIDGDGILAALADFIISRRS